MADEQNIYQALISPHEQIRQRIEELLNADPRMEGLYRVTSLEIHLETAHAAPLTAQDEMLPDNIPPYVQTKSEIEFNAEADRIPLFYKQGAELRGSIDADGTICIRRMLHKIRTPRPTFGAKEWHIDG